MIGTLFVEGFGTIAPYARLADFPLGPSGELPKPDLTLLERSLRRGLSDVTRLFMHSAMLALQSAGADARTVTPVFASAFGEIGTAEALLQQAYDENSSSPARFRHSVHNSAPGLFSISVHNQQPSTAIAAGWDTVAMALCECAAQLACGAEKILLVFAEERVPQALSAEHQHGPIGAAFVLSASDTGKARARISKLRRADANDAIDPFLGPNHPLGPALLLAQALEDQALRSVRVGEGDPPWCVEVDARAKS